jgi:hypothetical protein
VTQRRHAHLVTFAVIPFLLLSSAQSVTVRSTVYLDGSVKREVTAEFLQARQRNVLEQLRRALPEADSREVTPAGEGLKAVWSVILASAAALEGANLQYQDVAAVPYSPFTYYTFTETVQIPSETATEVEKADPSKATFKYIVTMPGTVTDATARPAKLETASPKPSGPATAAPSPAPALAAPSPSPPPPTPGPAPAAPPPSAAAPAPPPGPMPGATPAPAPAPGAPSASAAPAPTPLPATPPPSAPSAPAASAPPGAPSAAPPAAPTPAPAATPSPAAEAPAPVKKALGPTVTAEKEDSTATFNLSAANEAYDVTVTSRRVRWGYLAVIVYILAFIAYRIAAFLVHRAKVRPRRI